MVNITTQTLNKYCYSIRIKIKCDWNFLLVTNKTEHVWQNWMSTNDITSLEEEAKITTTSIQATTPNPAHTSSGPSTASNTMPTTASSSNSTENHTHTTHHSQPETTPNSSSSTACITATATNPDKSQSK